MGGVNNVPKENRECWQCGIPKKYLRSAGSPSQCLYSPIVCTRSQPACQRYNPFVSYSAGLKIAFFSPYTCHMASFLCIAKSQTATHSQWVPDAKDTYSTQYTLLPQNKNRKYFTWPMALPDINCDCYGWLLLTFCLSHCIQNVHNFLSKIQVNHPSAAWL